MLYVAFQSSDEENKRVAGGRLQTNMKGKNPKVTPTATWSKKNNSAQALYKITLLEMLQTHLCY